ncbi:MAG: ABC transporter ATP-binding protein [Candidatus Hodarchaeota archaeon]
MEGNNELLNVDRLTKIYISGLVRTALVVGAKDITFNIKKGEIVSLVGESGSGKSTVANMILRLIKPTSGQVCFKGIDIFEMKSQDYYKHVQVIFQDPFSSFNYFYKVDRVLNTAINFRYGKISDRERKELIKDVLEQIGINAEENLGRYPHQLSGGQMQRFLLARILLIKPDLLVADEPTSMIDASSRANILNLLKDLRKEEGLSILFITHDLGQAQYISDKVLIMKEGGVVEEGKTKEVFLHPTHPYTKNLLASVPSLYRRWQFD